MATILTDPRYPGVKGVFHNPDETAYFDLALLCEKRGLLSVLENIVRAECAEMEADWKKQIPKRPYTAKRARNDFDKVRLRAAVWVQADRFGTESPIPGLSCLPHKLTPDDVIRHSYPRLTAWTLAQKLRKDARKK